jgi:hypothetical protein
MPTSCVCFQGVTSASAGPDLQTRKTHQARTYIVQRPAVSASMVANRGLNPQPFQGIERTAMELQLH